MFDKLRKAFSNAAKGIGQKEITEKVLSDTLFDLEMSLLESDVAQEAVEALSARLKKELVGLKLEKGEDAAKVIQSKLQRTVAEVFANAGKFDLLENIKAKKSLKQGPYVVVFLGINGTGKTTTVAKIANMIRNNGFSVVVAAGDTHRAGAIEQLTQHANNLSLKVIAQRYGADPSAVGRDAVEHAKKNRIDAVLVDTAGRMQTSRNLMDEMAKIVRVVKPDAKLFIGDALAGNDTINQAREFFQYSSFDGAILTKIDADAKGGAAISIAYITSKPIAYVGIGQGYNDIIPFAPDKFIESLFGTAPEVTVEDLMSMPRLATSEIETTEAVPEPVPVPAQPSEAEKERPPAVLAAGSGIFAAGQSEARPQQPEKAESARAVAKPPALQEKEPMLPAQETVEERPKTSEPVASPPALPTQEARAEEKPAAPKPAQEPKDEKKGRFGGLFKKKTEDEKRKEEVRKREAEERAREEEERAKAEEEERERLEQEKQKKKRKTDKDTEDDKVIYLTDEDIEDLLK